MRNAHGGGPLRRRCVFMLMYISKKPENRVGRAAGGSEREKNQQNAGADKPPALERVLLRNLCFQNKAGGGITRLKRLRHRRRNRISVFREMGKCLPLAVHYDQMRHFLVPVDPEQFEYVRLCV